MNVFMFNSHETLFFIIGCLALIAFLVICFGQNLFRKKEYYSKPVITAFEQKMFLRLKEAFPQYHVLAQVAFSALITSDQYKLRSRFNRKVTDFVILDQSFRVLSIIELDDPSHIGQEKRDAERDAMFHQAGYQVLRYTSIPSIRQLKKDLPHS